jgi:LPXTG-site transpeptidase (sortase) family protein
MTFKIRTGWWIFGVAAIGLFIFSNWDYLLFLFGRQQYTSNFLVVPPASTLAAPSAAQEISQPNTLLIPSLNIAAPINFVDQNNETFFQQALQTGVVHFPGTALPGQSGNVYIFGHSSDFVWSKGHYKTVFAALPKITLGSSIIVSNAQGQQFDYTVVEKKVVSPSDLTVLAQDKTKSLLTLQTSYPLGTALKRYIVIAELKEKP